ncbi:MAG: AraC family transcriptional regulator [Eubacterium sp.]|nr:AraC family transcriptional regulator [Eubacterium sp.]
MKIGSIGYNYSHGNDFIMDRPNGPGSWLMLLIKTPAMFEINGIKQSVKKNSFVMISYDTPCKYWTSGDVYTDDWVYFAYEDGDNEKLAELNIPTNEIVYLGSVEEISQIIHILAYEHFTVNIYREEIEKHYTDIILLKLSRIIQTKSYVSSSSLVKQNYRFTQLRSRIYTMPDTVTDVQSMAHEMGMSVSGFQHLYKKIFNVNVKSDIINSRLERAKGLLSSTNLTVKEISEQCGYKSEYNFMKQFKRRFNQTPSEYRKIL